MTITVHTPNQSQISADEVLRNGNKSAEDKSRKISKSQAQAIDKFLAAHTKASLSGVGANANNVTYTTAGNQISAKEQADAATLRGAVQTNSKARKSEHLAMYELLYVNDDHFLKIDLDSFLQSLTDWEPSQKQTTRAIVDLNPNLPEKERNLRKYLLCQIALERLAPDDPMRTDVRNFIDRLSGDDLNYITDSIIAKKTGQTLGMRGVSLREFVKGYQSLDLIVESDDKEAKTTEILDLYRTIKGRVSKSSFVAEISKSLQGFYAVLTREKTQYPCKITGLRQGLIRTRIEQLILISKLVKLHQDFYQFCKRAGAQGLPSIQNLIENCLQYMASGEAYAGVNMLVQMGVNVHGSKPQIKSTVMSQYRRRVLLSPLLLDLYKSPDVHSKLTDALDKAEKSAAIHQLAKTTNF